MLDFNSTKEYQTKIKDMLNGDSPKRTVLSSVELCNIVVILAFSSLMYLWYDENNFWRLSNVSDDYRKKMIQSINQFQFKFNVSFVLSETNVCFK